MPRIPKLKPENLSEHQHRVYDSITGGPRGQGPQLFALTEPDGSLRGPFNAFLLSPKVGAAVEALGASLRYHSNLSPRLRELTILIVATHWDSAFEREAHEAIARHIGFTEEELLALRESDFSKLDIEEAQVAHVVSQLLAADLEDDQWDEAKQHLTDEQIFDLTTFVGYYSMLALQLRVFRT